MSGSPTRITAALPARYRARLMGIGREANFAQGVRLFDGGNHADRFWILRSGIVTLDIRVPGSAPVVIESLGPGELVGWSWLFKPYIWHLGAEAMTPVRTHGFDAETVLMAMDAESRLRFGRRPLSRAGPRQPLAGHPIRLLDLYAPRGIGRSVL